MATKLICFLLILSRYVRCVVVGNEWELHLFSSEGLGVDVNFRAVW